MRSPTAKEIWKPMGLRKFSYDINLRLKDRPCAHYICLERFARWTKKKDRLLLVYILSYSFGIETTNTFVHSWRSLENQTRFQTSGAKTLRVGAAHTYMAYQSGSTLPPRGLDGRVYSFQMCLRDILFVQCHDFNRAT